ncbi:hypothetical protein SAMN04487886_10806 [Clostridium sp. DSM 8431]|uniref:hypothetical protein n=1 Tax=Clostridium sp. DSM 8431 TaxID=1761781 RepID=UPI0008E94A0A|nr:hypothetical protein [Clostridium sp. DSM 8431]SFU62911.1 hypothetical protein SAMN04487886_10806 [Clostridium sp. DSM 8431]
MKRSKVIIYGLGRYFESAIDDIESRLEVVGYSDSSLQKEGIAKERKRLFIPPKNIKKYDFDYIIITSPDYFSEIKQYIINDLNICDEKVVSYDDLFIKEIYDGCGKLNKDKYFYVIKSSYCSAGLFAQYINVLLHVDKALKEGYLPIVDFKNLPNYYLDVDKLGIENSWEYYFENIIDIPLEEVYNSPNIKFSSDLYFLPKNIEDKKKREYYKKICREY